MNTFRELLEAKLITYDYKNNNETTKIKYEILSKSKVRFSFKGSDEIVVSTEPLKGKFIDPELAIDNWMKSTSKGK
jgi:hypothetical protein